MVLSIFYILALCNVLSLWSEQRSHVSVTLTSVQKQKVGSVEETLHFSPSVVQESIFQLENSLDLTLV